MQPLEITAADLDEGEYAAELSVTVSNTETVKFFVSHPNQKIQTIGQEALRQLVSACGMSTVDDSSDFVGMVVSVGRWADVKETAVRQWRKMGRQPVEVRECDKSQSLVNPTSGRFIYVISAENADQQLCKIGIANSPEKRIKTLSTSSPHALRLEFTRYSDDARAVERAAHAHFFESRQNGEWFAISADKAITYIIEATRSAA